jgi:hypothetical protein
MKAGKAIHESFTFIGLNSFLCYEFCGGLWGPGNSTRAAPARQWSNDSAETCRDHAGNA